MFEAIRQYYYNLVPSIEPKDWEALVSKLVVMHFKKGECIVKQGEICHYVYFINKGFLRFYKLIDGKEYCTGFIGEHEYVSSYDSFLTRKPTYESLEAMEDVEIVALSYTDMQALYNAHPVFQIFGRKIAEMLFIWINERSNALLLLSPEERYVRMIENGSELLQRIPQYMLASYIGVTPEHLSRIRKKWHRNNAIDIYQ